MATSGKIGEWNINGGGIINDNGEAYIIARNLSYDEFNEITGSAEARIGSNVFPASSGVVGVGYFENSIPNEFGTNYAAIFTASNANENVAIGCVGDFKHSVGKIITEDQMGQDVNVIYQGTDGEYFILFKNGILVDYGLNV